MRPKILAFFLVFASPVLAQTVAVRAGNVIDPAKGSVAKNQVILVQDGKIAQVGAGLEIPKGAEIVDLSREWVMPGLIDAHTHLTLTESAGPLLEASYLVESSTLRGFRGLQNAQIILDAGFTTVREVGNDANYATEDLRRAIERGWFVGPTILSSGKIIGPFGGQSHDIPPEQGPFWRFEYIDADGPAAVRQAVRQNIYYGADLIKLAADNSAYHYSLEEIQAAVDEAHHAGKAVAVHVYGGEAARNVILGGADSIEHGFYLTDDLLQLMKEKGTFLVGTDFPLAHLVAMGPIAGLPAPNYLGPKIVDRLRRAYRIGVKMAFGSDTVTELPDKTRADMMLDYPDVWREAGVPSADILKCMTTNAAELLRIDKQRGAIAAGLYADMIAMPESPLENIDALRKVNFVMKNGKIVRQPK